MSLFRGKRGYIAAVFIVFLAVSHYLHWDDRLIQLVKEYRLSEAERQSVSWFDGYNADIQEKEIPALLKAETSGLTWHEPSNSLFTITGKIPKLGQLSLEGDLLREIRLVGGLDTEGVVALSDGRFAIVDEKLAKLFIFPLPEGDEVDINAHVQVDLAAMDPSIAKPRNKSLEGVAWDERNSQFIFAKERDPLMLYVLPYNLSNDTHGTLRALSNEQLFVNDISGLAIDERSGNLLVLSHESKAMLVKNRLGNVVNFMSFEMGVNGLQRGIYQAEGIAIDKKGTLYIVGEPNIFYRFKSDKPQPKVIKSPNNQYFIDRAKKAAN